MSKFSYLLALGLLILAVFGARSLAQSPSPDADSAAQAVPSETPAPSPVYPVYQSPEEARAKDLALIAEAAGWTIEQAAAHRRAADIGGRIAGQVADQRPEVFIGSVLPPDPEGPPSLYIKGPADDFIRGLVAGAEIKINIVDNQPFSLQELKERKAQVVDALEAMGFGSFSASFRFEGAGQIEATVIRQPGLPDDPDEILAGLPAELRDSVILTVRDEPVGGPLLPAH